MPFNPQELIINTGEGIDSLYTASQKINQNFNDLKDILENYVAVGALICFGTYDASTAEYPTSPLLTKGSFWVITTGGTIDSVPYLPNDWIVYNDNDEWFKVDNGEITWSRVNKTFSDISDIQNRSHTDLQDIGNNTHDDIDEHISDTIIHAAIDDEADSLTTIWSSRRTAQGISNAAFGGLNLQNSVLASNLTEPPVSPSERDRYIVASPATGDWAGHEKDVAEYTNSAWAFTTPILGDCLICEADGTELAFNGTDWITRSTVTAAGGLYEVVFTQATSSPITVFSPPANAVIKKCVVIVDTAATSGNPTCSIGVFGTPERDMAATDSDLSRLGKYMYDPYTSCGESPLAIQVTLTGHVSSGVEGRIYIEYLVKK